MATRCYGYGINRRCYRTNAWGGWGRWALLGALIGAAILFFLLFACISARRRRKFGRKPFMGTGWAAPGHGPVTYNPNNNSKPMQTNNGYYGNQNQPYYNQNQGGQNSSYYQPPQNVQNPPPYGNQYGGSQQYQPPSYPPPSAQPNDGVVR